MPRWYRIWAVNGLGLCSWRSLTAERLTSFVRLRVNKKWLDENDKAVMENHDKSSQIRGKVDKELSTRLVAGASYWKSNRVLMLTLNGVFLFSSCSFFSPSLICLAKCGSCCSWTSAQPQRLSSGFQFPASMSVFLSWSTRRMSSWIVWRSHITGIFFHYSTNVVITVSAERDFMRL